MNAGDMWAFMTYNHKQVVGTVLVLGLLGHLFSASAFPQKQQRRFDQTRNGQAEHQWQAATYRGIIVGKSTRADMLRVFGRPKWSVPAADQDLNEPNPVIWNGYEKGGEFSGMFAVYVEKRSGLVVGMELSPENVSREEVINHFGPDYKISYYDGCPEFDGEEVGPVYESTEKRDNVWENALIEYRQKGIVIQLDWQGLVQGINYVNEPWGLKSKAECKKAWADHRARARRRRH